MTTLLLRWRSGDKDAGDRLLEVAYTNLRRLAAYYMKGESANHTMQPTELVSELYVKLAQGEPVDWKDRAHFFAVAGQQLRRLLVDHARAKHAQRRGGDNMRVVLDDISDEVAGKEKDLIDVENALQNLEKLDPRAARVVELRFFAGLNEDEAAEVLQISPATARRDWSFARAWLIRALK